MENQPVLQPASEPAKNQKTPRKYLKYLLVFIILITYSVALSFASIKLYQKKVADNEKAKAAQINPPSIIRQGLTNFLQTKTVKRHITYRDNLDKSMLVTWDIESDFSNPRNPKSHGTLAIEFLAGKEKHIQKLEFIAVKSAKYRNDLYFRITEGNAITNAPKDWFLLSSSDIISFERKDPYQRDSKINLFGLNKQATGFEKFKGFNFFLYNNPAFYIIIGDMRESPEMDKITSEINNDNAYVLQDCNNDATLSWCSGSFNTGGMASITSNYATSEGLGSEPDLKFDSTHFWLTANNQTKNIEKLEVGNNDSDKFVVTYSQHNQPVSITLPATFIK